MKIGYLGADRHGKSTLMAAVIQQTMGKVAVCPRFSCSWATKDVTMRVAVAYSEYRDFLHALKDPNTFEQVGSFLRRGGYVDLGCDPGMTSEGREIQDSLVLAAGESDESQRTH